jgi:hypothetical protein
MMLILKHFFLGRPVAHADPPASTNPVTEMISLSDEIVLVYVLRESGTRGRLTSGRLERTDSSTLDVFDRYGSQLEYLSGDRLRSWCVFAADGMPIVGWRRVSAEDLSKIPLHL